MRAVFFVEVEDIDDARVMQPPADARFIDKTRLKTG